MALPTAAARSPPQAQAPAQAHTRTQTLSSEEQQRQRPTPTHENAVLRALSRVSRRPTNEPPVDELEQRIQQFSETPVWSQYVLTFLENYRLIRHRQILEFVRARTIAPRDLSNAAVSAGSRIAFERAQEQELSSTLAKQLQALGPRLKVLHPDPLRICMMSLDMVSLNDLCGPAEQFLFYLTGRLDDIAAMPRHAVVNYLLRVHNWQFSAPAIGLLLKNDEDFFSELLVEKINSCRDFFSQLLTDQSRGSGIESIRSTHSHLMLSWPSPITRCAKSSDLIIYARQLYKRPPATDFCALFLTRNTELQRHGKGQRIFFVSKSSLSSRALERSTFNLTGHAGNANSVSTSTVALELILNLVNYVHGEMRAMSETIEMELDIMRFTIRSYPSWAKALHLTYLTDCCKEAQKTLRRLSSYLEFPISLVNDVETSENARLLSRMRAIVKSVQDTEQDLKTRERELLYIKIEVEKFSQFRSSLTGTMFAYAAAIYLPASFMTAFFGMNVTSNVSGVTPETEETSMLIWNLNSYYLITACLIVGTILIPRFAGKIFILAIDAWEFHTHMRRTATLAGLLAYVLAVYVGIPWDIPYAFVPAVSRQPPTNTPAHYVAWVAYTLLGPVVLCLLIVNKPMTARQNRRSFIFWTALLFFNVAAHLLDFFLAFFDRLHIRVHVFGMAPWVVYAFAFLFGDPRLRDPTNLKRARVIEASQGADVGTPMELRDLPAVVGSKPDRGDLAVNF